MSSVADQGANASSGRMRALLVHNDQAGTDPVPRGEIEAVLRAAGIEPVYCAHGDEDLTAALAGDHALVIAAGGDGTVADVVSTLVAVDRPVAILPLGGSNNIAHALGVNGDWRNLPALWALDRWTRLDRCEANGPWGRKTFVEALGSGVLTDAVEDAEEEPDTPQEKQRNGRAAFHEALCKAKPFACTVETGHWSWRGDCLMVEIMNIPFVGSRLALARDALPGDGLLDIVLVTPDDRASLLAWAEHPDALPCPIAPRRGATVRLGVDERPFRLDDRSPNEHLTGMVDIAIRPQWVKILTAMERAA